MTDNDQDMFDLAVDRDERREQQGYVTPAQARAFLQAAREMPTRSTRRHPPSVRSPAPISAPWIHQTQSDGGQPQRRRPLRTRRRHGSGRVVDVLLEAGVLPGQPRALLGGVARGSTHGAVTARRR